MVNLTYYSTDELSNVLGHFLFTNLLFCEGVYVICNEFIKFQNYSVLGVHVFILGLVMAKIFAMRPW